MKCNQITGWNWGKNLKEKRNATKKKKIPHHFGGKDSTDCRQFVNSHVLFVQFGYYYIHIDVGVIL